MHSDMVYTVYACIQYIYICIYMLYMYVTIAGCCRRHPNPNFVEVGSPSLCAESSVTSSEKSGSPSSVVVIPGTIFDMDFYEMFMGFVYGFHGMFHGFHEMFMFFFGFHGIFMGF